MYSRRRIVGSIIGAFALSVIPRTDAATFTVNTIYTGPCDAGQDCGIGAAINLANATAEHDTINFDIPGAGVHSIRVHIPVITGPLTIDGTTQPGYNAADPFPTPVITIDGDIINNNVGVLTIYGNDVTIRGLNIINGATGVWIEGNRNVVEGCFIGTDASGTVDIDYLPGFNFMSGIVLTNSSDCRIGGTTPVQRNLLSGNDLVAVEVYGPSSTRNKVIGNYVGTAVDGLTAIPNWYGGIVLSGGAHGNEVGGTGIGESNVISGNRDYGVYVLDALTRENTVAGNLIGTDRTGTAALGNGLAGVYIEDGFNNLIGGVTQDARNIISGNAQGVSIKGRFASGNKIQNNHIGTSIDGSAAVPNTANGIIVTDAPGTIIGGRGPANEIAGNRISGNGSNGIFLLGEHTTETVIESNEIGLGADGMTPMGNTECGILITDAPRNRIGGPDVSRNVISANGAQGIYIGGATATGNIVQYNYIGTDTGATTIDPDGNPANGFQLGNTGDGIQIAAAPGNTIGGTISSGNVIGGNLRGISILGATAVGNKVMGNVIGTGRDGLTILKNVFEGIAIYAGANGNYIGGDYATEGNTISGNGASGVRIEGATTTRNRVFGNAIGVDFNGTIAVPNEEDGVSIVGAPGNLIGSSVSGTGNVISGNASDGVHISGSQASGNRLEDNVIGLDLDGTAVLPNTNGVFIEDAPANVVGAFNAAAGLPNVISGNSERGVRVSGSSAVGNRIGGNYIGTDRTGTAALGNGLDGVLIVDAPGNRVGGPGVQSNIISGNGRGGGSGNGVAIIGAGAFANKVQYNLIGTTEDGTAALANLTDGIRIEDASRTSIGGFSGLEGNTISGNGGDGVSITGLTASGNRIEGNYIGTTLTGDAALPNAGAGVTIDNAPANIIGGRLTGSRNVISGNGDNGVAIAGPDASGNVLRNNFIGTNAAGNAKLPNTLAGVRIEDAPRSVIGGMAPSDRNIVSGNQSHGIHLIRSSQTQIKGNFIGTDVSGAIDLGNDSDGIRSEGPATGNQIGGSDLRVQNVVSGNLAGIRLSDTGTMVVGNLVGTDVTGTRAIPNGEGIELRSGNAMVGGAGVNDGNIISGNSGAGLVLTSSACTATEVTGNLIGVGADGMFPLPNGGSGISLTLGAGGNTIGPDNWIGHNQGNGVRVESGIENWIWENSIFANVGLGIDLGDDGVTLNDPLDPDTGANDLQNFPELTAVCNPLGTVTVAGTLSGPPGTGYAVDYYANGTCNGSGYGEGEEFIGTEFVLTDGGGTATLGFTSYEPVSAGAVITAVATDPNRNSSEFSQCEIAPGCTVAGLAPRIIGLEVFYNGRHGSAPDPSKAYLAVGQAGGAENVSSYAGGITGIRVVFNQLVTFIGGEAAAFTFEATPEHSAGTTFSAFVPPTPPVFKTTLFGNKTTVDITFADGEVKQRWLKTIVSALAVSGAGQMLNGELPAPLMLPSGDAAVGGDAEFIIGSLPCDTDGDFVVTESGDVTPLIGAVDPFTPAPIDMAFDVDKSGLVLSTDASLTTSFVDPAYTLPALP